MKLSRFLGLATTVLALGAGCGDGGKGSAGTGGQAGAGQGGGAGTGGSAGVGGSAGSAGAAGMGGVSITVPPGVVNEQMTHSTAMMDASYNEEEVTFFRTTAVLPDLDVRHIGVFDGRVYAGTSTGLVRLNTVGDAFETVAITGTGAVVGLAAFGDRVVAARRNEVHVLDSMGAPADVWAAAGASVQSVAASTSTVYVGTDTGLATIDAGGVIPVAAAQGFSINDLVVVGDVVWMATPSDVRRYSIMSDTLLADVGAGGLAEDVRAIAASSAGSEVLAGTNNGLWRIDATSAAVTVVAPGKDGLPNGDLTSVAEAAGTVLTGHVIGATATEAARKDHYHTTRWILDERVAGVAIEDDGTRWIATNAGISRIGSVTRTLESKAALMEALNDKHWRMDGFVADGVLLGDAWDDPVNPTSTVTRSDFDNDGLWTQMQVAAWCFAFAETGNTEFYDKARKAMDVMLLLYDVPAETFVAQGDKAGFITRSLVRSDEGAVFDSKATMDNWHLQEFDGQTYYWKDDTSSDEYAGHFFGIPIFYDLCAQSDAERNEIAVRIQRVTEYIIENELVLPDLDGEPTSHGDWAGLADAVDGIGPCLANMGSECAESFGGGGWLNSIEILGFLLASWHITGDDAFYAEYERLAIDERYGEMVPVKDTTLTVTSRGIANHSDHELATLAYYTLLRYEPNADRRATWIQSIRDFHSHEVLERNPFEIAMMSSAIDDPAVADAVRSLQEMPLDWREMRYDNTHRQDFDLDTSTDRFSQLQFNEVPPYDEIRTMKWNGNPYIVVGGSTDQAHQAPWPWLLPYWMMRYYGAIQ